jgi:L-lysine exporter family protein LysE/ArgO
MEKFVQGFLLQASLILALGAQNLFVLESGLKRQRHLWVATLCTLCDALLIALGVLGAATIFVRLPWLKILFGILGVAFLAYYGWIKLTEKPAKQKSTSFSSKKVVPLRVVTGQTLAFSLLNPHVYLDTLVLIGGFSAQFEDILDRLSFGSGAACFSMLWFFGLATFSASMSRYVNNAQIMRGVSIVSGVVLLALAVKLGLDVWRWTLI